MFVYFIQGNNFPNLYKIGKSLNPANRLLSFQCGSPDKLEIRHIIRTNSMTDLELYLHRIFNKFRVWKKHEWFDVPSDNLDLIRFLDTKELNFIVTKESYKFLSVVRTATASSLFSQIKELQKERQYYNLKYNVSKGRISKDEFGNKMESFKYLMSVKFNLAEKTISNRVGIAEKLSDKLSGIINNHIISDIFSELELLSKFSKKDQINIIETMINSNFYSVNQVGNYE